MFWASSEEMPILFRSFWQPVVMFWAAAIRVELLQGEAAQTPDNQLSMAGTTEVLAVVAKMLRAVKTLRHELISGLAMEALRAS